MPLATANGPVTPDPSTAVYRSSVSRAVHATCRIEGVEGGGRVIGDVTVPLSTVGVSGMDELVPVGADHSWLQTVGVPEQLVFPAASKAYRA